MRLLLVSVIALMVVGCTGYERFIATLNERQVTSCVKADLAIGGGMFSTGSASGAVHLVTATGGARLADCVRVMQFGQAPEEDPAPTIFIAPDPTEMTP